MLLYSTCKSTSELFSLHYKFAMYIEFKNYDSSHYLLLTDNIF